MKTVIEMAREAGLYPQFEEPTYFGQDWSLAGHGKDFERFAALVRAEAQAEEREACAKVCEGQIKIFLSPQYKTGQPMSSLGERHAVASCAEAIRARGLPPTQGGNE